jgi:hypothetical protein
MAISLDKIIQVTTSVITGAVGQPALIGNFLTNNVLVPSGGDAIVKSFTTLTQVGDYFGTSSNEYAVAFNYFLGYDNSTSKPQQILFSSYPTSAVAAYMFSQPIIAPTTVVNAIKALTSPTMVCHINGATQTLVLTQSDFSAITGLADVAEIIEVALDDVLAGCTCTVIGNNQFKIQAPSSGASTSTITFATGNVAVLMGLDTDGAPVLSQGTTGGNAAFNMTKILEINRNWIGLTYVTRLTGDAIGDDYAITVDLTSWINGQAGTNNYVGFWWEGGTQPKNLSSTTNLAEVLIGAGYGSKTNGQITFSPPIVLLYNGLSTTNSVTDDEIGRYSAFYTGVGASINYNVVNAKISFANKLQSGLTVIATTDTDYDSLLANGYEIYGRFASRTTSYDMTAKGIVGGAFAWLDNVYDAVWLSTEIQNSIATFLQASKRIPYNKEGINSVSSILSDVAATARRAGVIEVGNTFTQIEIQLLFELTRQDVSPILTQNGYFVYVPPITPEMRILRSNLPVFFIYTNGGAIIGVACNQTFVA